MKKEEKKTTKKKTTTKKVAKKVEPKKEVKEIKKVEPKKEVKETVEEMFGTSYKSAIIIVVVTLLFIALAICIASLVKSKETKKQTDSNVTIQYGEILLGTLFEQNENVYYVFVYNDNDNYINTYNTYLSNYKTKENALKVYTSALENGFNKKFISEEANLYVSNIDELRLTQTTLLKVENKQVVEAYSDKDSIISYLKQLVK